MIRLLSQSSGLVESQDSNQLIKFAWIKMITTVDRDQGNLIVTEADDCGVSESLFLINFMNCQF